MTSLMRRSRLLVFLALSSVACIELTALSVEGPLENTEQVTLMSSDLPWGGLPCSKGKTNKVSSCRPSFLIIGAGKSGTSSLYYYLQAHPQVEGARTKQIQFFDHRAQMGLNWYLGYAFPKTMRAGQVTGEASPGYIVYGRVPKLVVSLLPQVRVLAILREPLDRLWSSYHYNYLAVVGPLLNKSGKGSGRHGVVAELGHFTEVETAILRACFQRRGYDPRGGSSVSGRAVDFTEDCFKETPKSSPPATAAASKTVNHKKQERHPSPPRGNAEIKWYSAEWQLSQVRRAVARDHLSTKARSKSRADDEELRHHHYHYQHGGASSSASSSGGLEDRPSAAGAETTMEEEEEEEEDEALYANRVAIPAENTHLFRQFLSRGLYSLMLENWYASFSKDQILVLCTESLAATPVPTTSATAATSGAARTMQEVAAFLGIDPAFDFGPVVGRGKFNSAENRGYDAVTPWDQTMASAKDKAEVKKTAASSHLQAHKQHGRGGGGGDKEMDSELRRRLLEFYSPFNERLFDLMGKRCDWPT